MKSYMDVEDLEVYQKLCRLHIEICDLSHAWPRRRSTNSARKSAVLPIVPLHNSLRRTTIDMCAIRSRV